MAAANVAQQQEEEDWEATGVKELQSSLQKLSVKQQGEQEASPSNTQQEQEQEQEQDRKAAAPIDHAIVEALQKGREQDRRIITELENMVIKFINDTSRDILEFPSTFGTYQKMLAHRVAQSYGLQSSTIDYEDGHGRVIGTRTKDTRLRKVRLTKLDLSAPEFQQREVPGGGPKILFRRPGSHDHGRGSAAGDYKANFSSQSMKEREEDYNRARERLGIGSSGGGGVMDMPPGLQAGMRAMQVAPFPPGRGAYGGRGPMMQGRDIGGRGRGRKALIRDRDRELQDPDYVRGFNRDGSQQPYDQAGYDMEGYHEYPAAQQWGAMPYRVPPPPPPPHPSSPYQPTGPNHKGPAMPVSPVPGMAMYPATVPGMPQAVGQQQMAAMAARQPYPAGMQMAHYPMPGYPGPMAYHGMPGQQAMFAAQGMAHPYPGQMGAAFGYMDASGHDVSGMAAHAHPQGAYPMYATGYALYPQPHMPGVPGGMRAMAMPGMSPPGPGMEHMYHAGQYAYAMPPHGVSQPHGPAASEGKHHQHQGARPQSGHSSSAGHAEAGSSTAAGGSAASNPRHDSGTSNAT